MRIATRPRMSGAARAALALALAIGSAGANGAEPAAAIPAEAAEFFESRIRPVLAEHCYECHSANSKVLQGELRLDTAALLRRRPIGSGDRARPAGGQFADFGAAL